MEKRIVGFKTEECWRKTKERVGLHNAFAEPDRNPNLRGWLELDNGYIFFVDKEMYEKFTSFLGMFKK